MMVVLKSCCSGPAELEEAVNRQVIWLTLFLEIQPEVKLKLILCPSLWIVCTAGDNTVWFRSNQWPSRASMTTNIWIDSVSMFSLFVSVIIHYHILAAWLSVGLDMSCDFSWYPTRHLSTLRATRYHNWVLSFQRKWKLLLVILTSVVVYGIICAGGCCWRVRRDPSIINVFMRHVNLRLSNYQSI